MINGIIVVVMVTVGGDEIVKLLGVGCDRYNYYYYYYKEWNGRMGKHACAKKIAISQH